MQKHQNFEAELQANQPRIESVNKAGQELIDADHYAKEEIQERIEEIQSLWQQLVEQSDRKGEDFCSVLGLQIDNKQKIVAASAT